jgi:HEAT repeat protein
VKTVVFWGAVLGSIVGLLAAQTAPQVENAQVQSHTSQGSLKAQLAAFGSGPYWAAWQEPIIPGRHGDMCNDHQTAAPIRLEGPTALLVLVRIENAQVDQLRMASPDCRFDGGGLAFHWITGVPAGESVAWLKSQVSERNPDRALPVLALHAGPAATAALDELTAPAQPERVREKAAFWLGNSRGAQGVDVLKRMLANDPSPKVREQVVFALSQSKEASALAALIAEAKTDKTPAVRSKALFWLAQKAGKQAEDAIQNAVVSDPERSVKEQAVFALKQLPEDRGVPLLIEVAKNNPDPAVRKKAMFWLGESRDPRALEFFEKVLR